MLRAGGFLLLACFAFAQERPPSFDVASVKPTRHGRVDGLSISDDPAISSPGTFTATNNSLLELIRWAYRVKEYQVSGPGWMNDDTVCFDIEAKMPPGTRVAQARLMLQTLLRDRFRLAFHRETRTLPVYELVIAKGGVKLPEPVADAKRNISYEGKFWSTLKSDNTSPAELATFLADRLGRPVIDKTGIMTRFAVHLEYRISDDDMAHPSLFATLQEKLGLRLNAAKGPVEILVVDHIEKAPAAN
jgi:uncharacterized protein (TIGR03435 family)